MRRRSLVLAIVCAVIGTALPGVMAAQQATDHSGCITGSQQLVKVAQGDAPMSPCGPYETEIQWSAPTRTAVRSMTGDLVPDAMLLTEEVEPGVMQVLNDGIRSTLGDNQDIVAGADGSLWVFKGRQFYKLGDARSYDWKNDLFDTGQDSSEDIEVAPDGTLWWADRDRDGLKSFDGETWTLRRPAPEGEQGTVDQVEVLDDGTVLASWWLGGSGEGRREVAKLGEDGWDIIHSVGGSPDAWLGAGPAGEVSLMLQTQGDQPLYREVFPRSTASEVGRDDRPQGRIEWMDAGSDGTIWISLERGGLARHDANGWTEFGLPEGLYGLGGIQAAPDGSVWSATCGWSADGCELLRFDGEVWGRFLGSLMLDDIDEIAFAPNGTVWSISGANDLYAITPEATGASVAGASVAGASGVAAQDEAQPMTVAEVSSDFGDGPVTLDGIALQPKFAPYDNQYFFSDGTGIIIIDPRGEVPLLTPIHIVGHQLERDEIEVTSWTELAGPMENLGPHAEAFLAWVALLGDDDMSGPTTTDELLTLAVTEEVEPGVSRVVNDGVRDLAHRADGFPGAFVDIMPDGSVWLSGGGGKDDLFQFGREPTFRDVDGFQPGPIDPTQLAVSPIEWEDVLGLDGLWDARVQETAIAQDGTLWGAFRTFSDVGPDTQALARLDDSGWTVFTEADGVPIWGQHVGVFLSNYLLDIAPDGTVWVNASAAPHGCDGVASFDGTTWTRYLRGRCVHDLDIAHDGMVWVRAYLEDTGVEGVDPRVGTFVIRPTTAAAP